MIRGNFITPRYFETLGIPLRAGRTFGPQDSLAAPKTAIVNETLARKFFPGTPPVGQHFRLADADADTTIVGVVRDFTYNHIREDTPPLIFLPYAQFPGNLPNLTVHTSGSAAEIRQAIKEVAGSLPVLTATRLTELVDRTLSDRRTRGAVGRVLWPARDFSGVDRNLWNSFLRRRRTHKRNGHSVGTGRPAAASPLDRAARYVGSGCSRNWYWHRGCNGWRAAGGNLLYGLKGSDPVTLTGASVLLLGVATAAAYWPARRASRIDPLAALRTSDASNSGPIREQDFFRKTS